MDCAQIGGFSSVDQYLPGGTKGGVMAELQDYDLVVLLVDTPAMHKED
ncbi:MAG: hypothetical protein AAGA67_08145 [Cyanobacteria bacterium P01_F01_bin.153]